MKLKNAVVVVTGSRRGLDRALARAFSDAGAKVVVSSRSTEELNATAAEVNAVSIKADVTKESEVLNLAEQTVKRFKKIDIWVNNAGIRIPHGPVDELDFKRVHEMMNVNLFGTMHGAKAALLQMKKQRGGIILNIISTSALEGRANASAYAASKFAAAGFCKSLRLEAEPHHIHVINVYPGGMRTNFFDEQKPDNYDEYMDPSFVAEKIVSNIQRPSPEPELFIKRPTK